MAGVSQATFTPAASSHTTPAVCGGAQEFKGLGSGPGSMVTIVSASLRIDGAAETSTWQLHLYGVTPPSAIADAASFTLGGTDRAAYLGFIAFIQTVSLGTGTVSQYIETNNIQKTIRLPSSGSVFGYLVNGTTLTPGAVAHVVTLGAVGAT